MSNLSAQQFTQTVHRVSAAASHIEGILGHIWNSRCIKNICNIRHICKISGLISIPHYSKRLPCQLLSQEHSKHRPISARSSGTGPIHIKETQGNNRKTVHLPPVKHCLLPQPFGQSIRILGTNLGCLLCGIFIRNPVTGRRSRINQFPDSCIPGAFHHMISP